MRSLPLRLTRSFVTTPGSRNASPAVPSPPRRKGRTPKVNLKTESILPPHKLRALVSLYHQSDDFITPENLLDRIDAAFLVDSNDKFRSSNSIRHESYDDLLKFQRAIPRMAPWDLESIGSASYVDEEGRKSVSWSAGAIGRERQILEALYGVDSTQSAGRPLPGYDTLKEARELKQKREG